jgi:hypothetical protein
MVTSVFILSFILFLRALTESGYDNNRRFFLVVLIMLAGQNDFADLRVVSGPNAAPPVVVEVVESLSLPEDVLVCGMDTALDVEPSPMAVADSRIDSWRRESLGDGGGESFPTSDESQGAASIGSIGRSVGSSVGDGNGD